MGRSIWVDLPTHQNGVGLVGIFNPPIRFGPTRLTYQIDKQKTSQLPSMFAFFLIKNKNKNNLKV